MTMAKGWARKAQSVVVSVGQKNLRFPLWILNFWCKVSEVVEQRTGWKEAQGWMSRMVGGLEIQKAEKLFGRIQWGLRLWPFTGYDEMVGVGFLAELLSNKWLAERLALKTAQRVPLSLRGLGPLYSLMVMCMSAKVQLYP